MAHPCLLFFMESNELEHIVFAVRGSFKLPSGVRSGKLELFLPTARPDFVLRENNLAAFAHAFEQAPSAA
jgi:hypothetical protein